MALVKLTLRLRCTWTGFPPEYRLYVNGELFSDRTYDIESHEYMEENILVDGDAGIYVVAIESKHLDAFEILPLCVAGGPARALSNNSFEITDEKTIH